VGNLPFRGTGLAWEFSRRPPQHLHNVIISSKFGASSVLCQRLCGSGFCVCGRTGRGSYRGEEQLDIQNGVLIHACQHLASVVQHIASFLY
jgi:hypothetical protein